MVSPVVGRHEYLGKLQLDKLPHAVEILATTVLSVTRDLSELSERYDLNSGHSVEPTLLLHLAVVLATETRPHNSIMCCLSHITSITVLLILSEVAKKNHHNLIFG